MLRLGHVVTIPNPDKGKSSAPLKGVFSDDSKSKKSGLRPKF